MAVHFKFKSSKAFESVTFDGPFISVANLKEMIIDKKKLRNGTDYDIKLSKPENDEEYTDEECLVPKNTSVLVRRIPRPTVTIVVGEQPLSRVTPSLVKKFEVVLDSAEKAKSKGAPDAELDDFGIDLYAPAELNPAPVSVLSKDSEDDRISALVNNSAISWEREVQNSGRGYVNTGRAREQPLRGQKNTGFQKQTPPPGYVCHRCRVAGHFIQHCPTNGDPDYDVKKVRPPTGIPKTRLVPDSEGTYFLPTGEVAVMKPNEKVFEREVSHLPPSNHTIGYPSELCCPVCKDVLKDAVLTSKCCFKSYCDKCIRDEILSKGMCACGATNILADDLLPNKTLRDAIQKLLYAQGISFGSSGNVSTVTTSSGSAGTRVQVPDTQSAHRRSRMNSTAVSRGLKRTFSAYPESDISDTESSGLRKRIRA
jgi:E3 ubiquitin-protein ligase RBBP6